MDDLNNKNANWLIRYKLYHLPFWFAYHYLWWSLSMGSIVEPANNILYTPYSIKFLAYMVFQAIGVYFNLYYLVPRFLEKGKYVMYGGFLLVTILTTAAVTVSGYYAAAFLSGKPFQELFGREPSDYWFFFKTYSLPSTVACMTLGMSIKLTKNWIQSTRRQQLLEKEKLETELKFLRSQFNPHFLFNTINSIFFLIHKNPMLASNALAKFSDLLRFQLYECNEKQIPLSNELTYLENFIELQKLRVSKNVNISLDIDDNPKYDLAIAPFVLITFTENAFKHLSDFSDQPNWIKIKLRWNETDFQFNISNSVDTFKKKDVLNYGGLGLKNIKRRLDLIYPEQYQLEILSGTNSFEVQLNLKLTEISDAVVIHKSA